jgi:hypothetical protein
LDFASQRIARYKPEIYLRNVLEALFIDAVKFDSVGLNYLLHCVPGSIESKNAVLFGSTLLQGDVPCNWFAKRLMDVYNKKGIFSNQHDSLDGLKQALDQRFRDVSIEIIGCAALFSRFV